MYPRSPTDQTHKVLNNYSLFLPILLLFQSHRKKNTRLLVIVYIKYIYKSITDIFFLIFLITRENRK